MKPVGQKKEVFVYWGPTGTGKSYRAWKEAGLDAYPKIPSKVTWDGYQVEKHKHVIFEEFTGQIGIEYMLRWLDEYPVIVDVKFAGSVLTCKKIWITSNVDPMDWYPTAPQEQKLALMRRMTVKKMDVKYVKPLPIPLVPLASMNHDYWRDQGNNDRDYECAAKQLDEMFDTEEDLLALLMD